MTARLSAFYLLLFFPPISLAVPLGTADNYSTPDGTPLNIPAAGVLANDSGTGTLSAVLESNVSNGSLSLNTDGSFSYTPTPGFIGTDSFTYRVSEPPTGSQVFTIVENSSNSAIDASLNTSIGSDSDSDSSRLRGTLAATVTPSSTPFSQIHITDFDVKNADPVALDFRFLFGAARIAVSAPAEGITIEMTTPSPAVPVNNGSFSQLQNTSRGFGSVTATGSGLAAGLVPEGPQMFDNTGVLIDLVGTITQSGNTLTLAAPFEFNGNFEIDASTTIGLEISGNLVATSPVRSPTLSPPVTVTISVTPPPFIDTDMDGMDDNWELANNLTVGTNDAQDDADGDTQSNLSEYIASTDPQDPTSLLKILTVTNAVGGDLTISFTSVPGLTYQLQHATTPSAFTDVPGLTLNATTSTSSFSTTPPDLNRSYLRVIVVPPAI